MIAASAPAPLASFTRRLPEWMICRAVNCLTRSYILRTFPDIAQAVRDGQFSSGYHHWALHGRFELAAGQRVAGSSFLLAALDHGVEGFAAGDDLLGDLAVEEYLAGGRGARLGRGA